MKLTKPVKVNLIRNNLATSLAAYLPSFLFFNPGFLREKVGDRVRVSWGSESFWFDEEAIQKA